MKNFLKKFFGGFNFPDILTDLAANYTNFHGFFNRKEKVCEEESKVFDDQ